MAELAASNLIILSPIQPSESLFCQDSIGRKKSKVLNPTTKPTILSPIKPPNPEPNPSRSNVGRNKSKSSSSKQAESATSNPTIFSHIHPTAPVPLQSSIGRKRSKSSSSPNKPTILSPIQPSASPPPQPIAQEQDPLWSHKVRRSYSRLNMNDRSFESPKPHSASSPTRRETLFGFEKLQTPEVIRKADMLKGSMSNIAVGSFNLSATDDSVCNTPEPDLNIPGVCLVKKNVRRKRVPQIKVKEGVL